MVEFQYALENDDLGDRDIIDLGLEIAKMQNRTEEEAQKCVSSMYTEDISHQLPPNASPIAPAQDSSFTQTYTFDSEEEFPIEDSSSPINAGKCTNSNFLSNQIHFF